MLSSGSNLHPRSGMLSVRKGSRWAFTYLIPVSFKLVLCKSEDLHRKHFLGDPEADVSLSCKELYVLIRDLYIFCICAHWVKILHIMLWFLALSTHCKYTIVCKYMYIKLALLDGISTFLVSEKVLIPWRGLRYWSIGFGFSIICIYCLRMPLLLRYSILYILKYCIELSEYLYMCIWINFSK